MHRTLYIIYIYACACLDFKGDVCAYTMYYACTECVTKKREFCDRCLAVAGPAAAAAAL